MRVGGAPTQKLTKSQLTIMCKLGMWVPTQRNWNNNFYRQCELGWDDEINFGKISFLSHSHIPDRKTGLELAEKYGIDGVMINRGIFHNPFAFEKEPREHTSKELLDLLRLHLSLFNKYEKDEIRQFKSLRRFFKIYVRGIRGASELRHQLMNTQSIAEARALLDEFEAQMDEDVKIEL
ncbi:tRNA dihydrouridine synthase B [Staphylococcus aureus]|nr:tRNA dihydrouridine synthase B [Staphylococcus aureus]